MWEIMILVTWEYMRVYGEMGDDPIVVIGLGVVATDHITVVCDNQ